MLDSYLKEAFDSQYEKGIEEAMDFKAGVEALLARKQFSEASNLISSSYAAIQSVFATIDCNISRFIETRIIDKSDEPHFKEFSNRVLDQLDKLAQFKEAKEKEISNEKNERTH